MTVWRRAAALLLGMGFALSGGRRAGAQSVNLSMAIIQDSISPAPAVLVEGTPGPPELGPYTITLEVALEPQFRAPVFVGSSPNLSATFAIDSLLPERKIANFRARIIDRFGGVHEIVRAFPVHSWLRLISPTRAINDVLFTRTPTFSWSSPGITLPPGPWSYDITITNIATGRFEQHTTSDTAFVPSTPLDACTSYRWSVTARAVNGGDHDEVTLNSPGTFVIQSAECPTATIFYQNFPNPFGRGASQPMTCFWFDLAHRSTVKLTIYDLRLRPVKRIVPGILPAQLDSGAYGRQSAGVDGGCDARLSWDGTDDRGRPVPPGVYIAVFEADRFRSTKKIVYRGR
jgi:hypothetical protein